MVEPPAKKKRAHVFQESGSASSRQSYSVKGTGIEGEEGEMTCNLCRTFSVREKRSGGGYDARIQGCKRLKIKVGEEDKCSEKESLRYAEAAAS